MNTRKRKHNSGFTLVEILIVVVILGILSAIVIPQFTNASEMAKASAVTTQLQTIRSQMELYRVQHEGIYPTAAQLWGNMTGKTDADGTPNSSSGKFGPYLQKAPTNSFNNKSTVNETKAAGIGWEYILDSAKTSYTIKAILTTAQATTAGFDITSGSSDLEDIATY